MFELIHKKLDNLTLLVRAIARQQGLDHATISAILDKEGKIMSSIDDIVSEVGKEKDEIASVKVFISSLQQQLADALANANLSPANQAKVDAVFAQLQSNSADLASAIVTPGGG